MEHYNDKEFKTKKELFEFIIQNKETLIAQKKSVTKQVDCSVALAPVIVKDQKIVNKEEGGNIPDVDVDSLKVVVLINTTNYFDSHRDVHIGGIWKKSLKENTMILHLQEHEMEFDKIIASGEQLKAYTKNYTWAELGYPYEGTTEGLTFESTILKKRNEFMLNQYANGWVENHSVSMRYVKFDFAINDEDYPNEYEAWKKYYPLIANKEDVDQYGYFSYVLEAKVIEGSAVPIGSNRATPTLSNGTEDSQPPEGTGKKIEPSKDTQTKVEPDNSTQKESIYSYLSKNINLKI